jgi:ATP-binding cassette subfamily B protein
MSTTLLGGFLTFAATIVGLIPPFIIMPLTDKVLIPWQNGQLVSRSTVVLYLSALAFAAILTWILSWAKLFVMALASEQISKDLRNETYAHLNRLSLDFYGGRRTGDLISRISDDTERLCNFLSVHLVDFSSDVLMFLLTSAVLIWIDPVLAAATLIPLPVIAWLVQRVRIRLRHGFARGVNAWSEMVSVLTDAIPGVRVVKAFAQEQREVDRFVQANTNVYDANTSVNKLWSFFGPTVTFLTELGVLVIWGFGVWRVANGSITVGVLTAFLAYISRFYLRLDSMSRMLANTQRAAASTHRIFEILDRKPAVMEPAQPIHPGKLKGGLVIQNVRFKYGTREVLKGVNLEVEPGELVGLVGTSGSGKSTLVNLVCRFYDPTQGSILADGIDIKSFPVEEFRRNIGIVLQDPFLFFGTIAENIAYGRPDATRGEIIQAARAAHAHAFIVKLPDGYDSMVGERGQSLSGGERQRISIARALLTDPRILILDEATSAVDNETEREIQKALENLIRGRTTIAIAHRLSTLRNADRIVVLDDGQVAEVGKHEELLRTEGIYHRLYHAQRDLAELVQL